MTSITAVRYDSSYHLHIIKPYDIDGGPKVKELADQHQTTIAELERLNPEIANLKEGDLLMTPMPRSR
ncbi:hypothetical protein A3K48_04070 [candidate division WOR-1 bacterium RIFOXYA12_FULL_52_29]|uniref:LysM domain-containing protein n=1 Tax=candidate division WOR-1 bacterium RIFOXYC12_FULL_54_18 TaxID=1802584 RepID=A0A1F4T6E5_UNCSA|nr:MAG: hypothetical protein A3K44_04070 [candidate division WOR-1 bacterium RIFOXYA2_FULL_51_19]OGC17730.1 MAG: hypothetical protein A3K48_04070 [candidate division WOR-1 bacterium RIFOXYA12_FULL_52_29]OGC26587.1 MAG: hypothetical protein A3K32_04065 [candidate division WOR-1 bacterium RIFOXYB2_FULL_45_9]OGC28147.1 MAG: hypothetical protein A3K49_04070 [candidate division WOR-1 bacterium RIFOXYC12_FULL_54_18]OGC29567.1 MAG: hypothetical protein A2346_02265 [candidate division WOR-1 bacterium R